MGHDPEDFLDPRNWDRLGMFAEREYRIYADDRHAEIYAVVDEIDYYWAIRWRWRIKRQGRNIKDKKSKALYFYRGVHPPSERKVTLSEYLHVAIMLRTGIKPETDEHTIADHKDRNTLNCRRYNLHWATPGMNSKNRTAKTSE